MPTSRYRDPGDQQPSPRIHPENLGLARAALGVRVAAPLLSALVMLATPQAVERGTLPWGVPLI